ncbi:LmbE-like protein [Aspergillus homomorphus CBS 101889]|uniref:N-acetylglucosaminylphosphatidylinositol deacetylase n=1 Tax=Aspergillus homomorphus (strain CBS 101889) TaxID=1450537 RepID=A0A395I364_ASPHC|nr:LmbE-like protein [Aspergillus homomorphus CBS 101889]RAL14641.1 LmbE-like protein [Aspergillus homomorphus CBS 101889]
MNTSTLTTIGLAIAVVFMFWTLSSTTSSPFAGAFPRIYNKRICLLIAHPDDEAMFFAPTLGLRNEADVYVVDDPSRFPDSMSARWTEHDVATLLGSAFAPETAPTKKAGGAAAPTATIDVLLTFDQGGISNHPNHRSLYHGAVHWLRTLTKGKPGYKCPVALYTLTTTNIVRKYAGVLDAPFTMVGGALRSIVSGSGARGFGDQLPSRLLFVSSVGEWVTAQSAMVKAHRSQMVWFRWGWITIGRYMAVNDLRRERV